MALLLAGSAGFALLATDSAAPFVAGALVAFALGWGWPGLFNLAVVDRHREAPGAATGVSQTGHLRRRGRRARRRSARSTRETGYAAAWLAVAASALLAAGVMCWRPGAGAGRRLSRCDDHRSCVDSGFSLLVRV